MRRLELLILPLVFFGIACGKKAADPNPSNDPVATPGAPVTVTAPAGKPAPSVDLSGRWDCTWNTPDAGGTETWILIHDGSAVRVNFVGRDPGGQYAGTMTGTAKGNEVAFAYEYTEGIKGTTKMKYSKVGKMMIGDSLRATPDVVTRYSCARSPLAVDPEDFSGKWECLWSGPGKRGAETWSLFHDDNGITATLIGTDGAGRYTGSLIGKVTTNQLALTHQVGNATTNFPLVLTRNRAVASGEVTTSRTKTAVPYACARM